MSHRLEIDADSAKTVAQRYPGAGTPNPRTELFVVDLESLKHSRIWQSSAESEYLARVHPIKGGFLLQSQDRLQQNLFFDEFLFAEHPPCGSIEDDSIQCLQRLHTEHSDTWINLTDNLQVLDNESVIFTSEESGTGTIKHIDRVTKETNTLLGPKHVNQILKVTATAIFVAGWDDKPTANHLFAFLLMGTATSS